MIRVSKQIIRKYVRMILYTICLLILSFLTFIYRDTLNQYAPLMQFIAVLILIGVTLYYAISTHNMQKLMEKQIKADIELSNLRIERNITRAWFLRALTQPELISFELSFDIYNENSASGSIEVPSLFLKFRNDGFEQEIRLNGSHIYNEEDKQRVFLLGGELRKKKLPYFLSLSYVSNASALTEPIREHFDSLEFRIRYRDNLGKPYDLKVEYIT